MSVGPPRGFPPCDAPQPVIPGSACTLKQHLQDAARATSGGTHVSSHVRYAVLTTNARSAGVATLAGHLRTAGVRRLDVFVGLQAKSTSREAMLAFVRATGLARHVPSITGQLTTRKSLSPRLHKWRVICIALSIWGMWSTLLVHVPPTGEEPRALAHAPAGHAPAGGVVYVFLEEDVSISSAFVRNILRALPRLPTDWDYFNAHPNRPLGPAVAGVPVEVCTGRAGAHGDDGPKHRSAAVTSASEDELSSVTGSSRWLAQRQLFDALTRPSASSSTAHGLLHARERPPPHAGTHALAGCRFGDAELYRYRPQTPCFDGDGTIVNHGVWTSSYALRQRTVPRVFRALDAHFRQHAPWAPRAMDKDLTTAISTQGLNAYGLRVTPSLCAAAPPEDQHANRSMAARETDGVSPFAYRSDMVCAAVDCCRTWGRALEANCLQPMSVHDG